MENIFVEAIGHFFIGIPYPLRRRNTFRGKKDHRERATEREKERAKVREISGRAPCKGSKKRKYVKTGQIKQDRKERVKFN